VVTKAVTKYQSLDQSQRTNDQRFSHSYFWSLLQSLSQAETDFVDVALSQAEADFADVATEYSVSKGLISCSEIWRNRNNEIFQHVKKDTLASVNNIFSYHSSMVQALGPIHMQCVTRHVHWHPLLKVLLKLMWMAILLAILVMHIMAVF